MNKISIVVGLSLVFYAFSVSAGPNKPTPSNNRSQPVIRQDYKVYDKNNTYKGKAEWAPYGRYRLYNKDGQYTGHAEPKSSYGQTWVYDANGKFLYKLKDK